MGARPPSLDAGDICRLLACCAVGSARPTVSLFGPGTAANLGKVTVLEIQWGNMNSIEALHQLLGDSALGCVWNRTRGTARPLWAKGATILVPGVDPRLLIPAAVEMIGLRHIVVYEGHQHHVCRALNRGWPAFGRCVHGNRRLAGMTEVD